MFKTTTKDEIFLKDCVNALKPKVLKKHRIESHQAKTVSTNHYSKVFDILKIVATSVYEKQFIVPGCVVFKEIGGQGQLPSLYIKFFNALKHRLNIFYEKKINIKPFPDLNPNIIPKTLAEFYSNFSDMFYYNFMGFNIVNLNKINRKGISEKELLNFIKSQDLYFLRKKYLTFVPKKGIIPHIFSQVICGTSISFEFFLERLAIEFPSVDQYYYMKLKDMETNLLKFIDDGSLSKLFVGIKL